MNRRGFVSLLVGAAGASLVPWRGLVEPLVFLPSRKLPYCTCTSPFCNRLHKGSFLTEESLEDMMRQLRESMDRYGKPVAIRPTHFIVPAVGTVQGGIVGPAAYPSPAGVEVVVEPRLLPEHWYLRTPLLT